MLSAAHIHPMLVHFPIVFVLTLAVLDVAATIAGKSVTGRSALGNASTALAVLAALFAIVTYAFGDMALDIAESTGWSSETAEIHEHLGMATTAVLVVWAAVRLFAWLRNARLPGWARTMVPLVELGGAAAVVVTAYFGGQLVYNLGVNVAHM